MYLEIFGLNWSLKADKVYFSLSHWGLIKGLKIFVLKWSHEKRIMEALWNLRSTGSTATNQKEGFKNMNSPDALSHPPRRFKVGPTT
jgi:hypothetical protein